MYVSQAAKLALLLSMLLSGPFLGAATDLDEDLNDGVVEDVQEEPSTTTVDENGEEFLYESPEYDAKQFYFVDHFDDVVESSKRWIKSQAKKDDIAEEISKYDGQWNWEAPQRIVWKNDIGLVLKSKAKHAAIATRLSKQFTFKEEEPLVVQYEVTLQDGQECGGSYIKLLSAGKHTEDLTKFNDKTPYTIMFGPDKCGNDIKLHFIFRHVNPINGTVSEKHARKPKDRLEEPFKDKLPHLYQLVVRPDNTFEVRVDNKIVNEGSLLNDFTPAVNPPREIDDPEDKKPKDWDEREKIPDPTATKPEDWDDDAPPQIPDPSAVKPNNWLEEEPEMIPDPNAVKPEDWDTEIDGEWEPPLVDNPICAKVDGCGPWKAPLIANKEYRGKWRAPMIDNPNYQGKWAPRKIVNPDFFEDLNPFRMTPIDAIGIELWSMSSDILFDNLIITDDVDVAQDFATKTYDLKRKYIDRESSSFLNTMLNYMALNPWFWRIVLIIVATVIAYALYYTCRKSDKKELADKSASDKKTDAPQEDDEAAGGDTEATRQTPEKENDASPKKKKSDLDVKESTPVEDKAEKSEGSEEEVENIEEKNGAGVRKRRARKDQS